MIFETMSDVRAANAAAGRHWFSPASLRFFDSIIGDDLYGGQYFVTSEQPPQFSDGSERSPRRWTVRIAFAPTGEIQNASDFLAFESEADAIAYARHLSGDAP